MRMKAVKVMKENVVWLMLIVLIGMFAIATPMFFTTGNLITVLRQISNTGILAIAMSFVVIGGGIDLSIGNMMGVVGMVTALLLTETNLPVVLSCILGVLLAGGLGLINGLLVTYTKMPPLIMTLGMSYVCLGCAFLTTGGFPVYGLPESIKILGQGYVFGSIPVCVLILIAVIVIGALVLNKTNYGRYIYAIGSNEEAARLSGINEKFMRVSTYVISGMLAGLSGLLMMSRVNSGQAKNGNGMEMDALIACVVGGVSVAGGEGKASGIIGGMLVMGVLANGMAVMGMSDYTQTLVKGLVLIVVVAVDSFSRIHSAGKKAA